MTDRTLLKKAAQVEGLEIVGWSESSAYVKKDGDVVQWSPLDDSGDALRLKCASEGLDPALERRRIVLEAIKANPRAFTCFKCETHTANGEFKTIGGIRAWRCNQCQEST